MLKPVHFKNGNTRLRVFPKYVDESDALAIPTIQMERNRDKNSSGDESSVKNQSAPITPPGNSLGPFGVKRSFSEDMEQRSSPKRTFADPAKSVSPVETNAQSCPKYDQAQSQNLLNILLKHQLTNPSADLLAQGLLGLSQSYLPMCSLPQYDTPSSTLLASSLSSLPTASLTYSSPVTSFKNPFVTSPVFNDSSSRKHEENDSVICPTRKLSELSIGITEPTSFAEQPKLTPGMIMISGSNTERGPEPFTANLMISPSANRSHPLFKQFLATVRELEKQMLYEFNS